MLEEIASCSEQLRAVCGVEWCEENDGDEAADDTDTHSAADIASECLALLESLSVATDNVDANDADASGGLDVSSELSPTHSSSVETALLREINDLGSELQALMSALCPPAIEIQEERNTPSGDSGSQGDDDVEHAANPGWSDSMCTRPKMAALTKRLERRPSTQRMLVHTALRRHRSFPLGLKSPTPSLGKTGTREAVSDRRTKSATRVILSDAAFWRQYQSKSFQRHLTRQSQARANQQREKESENKAIEYRYRRVAKPCYPLAKGKLEREARNVEASTHAKKVTLPVGSQRYQTSYAERHHKVNIDGSRCDDPREEEGLLCGVYLHGKRRSHGMLYLTCLSLDQLKKRVAKKFQLDQPVVNLYREQIATDLGGARQRKYLHRVARFEELRDGDLLCATTDGYDDMAILCAWMKKRQQMIHNYRSPQKPRAAQCSKTEGGPQPPKPVQKSEPSDSLAYRKPPPPPPIKLWDENGRLVSISHRLPLEE